jgi:hypothetical protein
LKAGMGLTTNGESVDIKLNQRSRSVRLRWFLRKGKVVCAPVHQELSEDVSF